MARIDLERQADDILAQGASILNTQNFDILRTNLSTISSFLETYNNNKAKLSNKMQENLRFRLIRIKQLHQKLETLIKTEFARREIISQETASFLELQEKFQEYEKVNAYSISEQWRNNVTLRFPENFDISIDYTTALTPDQKHTGRGMMRVPLYTEQEQALITHFILVADVFNIDLKSLGGKSLADLEAIVEEKRREMQQHKASIDVASGGLPRSTVEKDKADLAQIEADFAGCDTEFYAAQQEVDRLEAEKDTATRELDAARTAYANFFQRADVRTMLEELAPDISFPRHTAFTPDSPEVIKLQERFNALNPEALRNKIEESQRLLACVQISNIIQKEINRQGSFMLYGKKYTHENQAELR